MIFPGAIAIIVAKTTIIEVDSIIKALWEEVQAQIVTILSCRVATRIATLTAWGTARAVSKAPSRTARRNKTLLPTLAPTTEIVEAMDTLVATTATNLSLAEEHTTISTEINISSTSLPIRMVEAVTTTIATTTTNIMATTIVAATTQDAVRAKQPARSAISSCSRTQRAIKLTMPARHNSTCSRCRATNSSKMSLDIQTGAALQPKPQPTTTTTTRTTTASRLTARRQLRPIRTMDSSKQPQRPMATITTSSSSTPTTTTTSSSNSSSSRQHSTARQQTRSKLKTAVGQQLEAQDRNQVSRQEAIKAPIEERTHWSRSEKRTELLLECKLIGPASECKCRGVHMTDYHYFTTQPTTTHLLLQLRRRVTPSLCCQYLHLIVTPLLVWLT